MSSKVSADKAPAKKNSVKKGPERGLGRGLSSLLGDKGVAIATGMAGAAGARLPKVISSKNLMKLVAFPFLDCVRYL